MPRISAFVLYMLGIFLVSACTANLFPSTPGMRTPSPSTATATPGEMTPRGDSHGMQPIGDNTAPLAVQTIGGQLLPYRLENGVKVFELTAQMVRWPILEEALVTAMTYNGTVPGPMIKVTEGDRVKVVFTNQLEEPTTIHWHGIEVPNAMDGVPGITQAPILPGETFTYEFVAKPAGTFIYHSHYESDRQVSAGLYGPFIIEPRSPQRPQPDVDVTLMLSEWLIRDGVTYPAMPMSGMEPNYFTINGKAYPNTETLHVKVGQSVRLRLIGIGQFIHPMHLHGFPFKVTAMDGHPIPEMAQPTMDTLSVAPGQRFDIEFTPTEPGRWMFHCHILHHTTNNNIDPGGLMMIIDVTP